MLFFKPGIFKTDNYKQTWTYANALKSNKNKHFGRNKEYAIIDFYFVILSQEVAFNSSGLHQFCSQKTDDERENKNTVKLQEMGKNVGNILLSDKSGFLHALPIQHTT